MPLQNKIEQQMRKFEEKLAKILFSGFGAFGITISMSNGGVTDGAIQIRDKSIRDAQAILSSCQQELIQEVVKMVKNFVQVEGVSMSQAKALDDIIAELE